MSAKFSPGRLLATPGAIEAMMEAGVDPVSLLLRHLSGDFGQLDEHDRRQNEIALLYGSRILSVYFAGTVKLYVITEATDDHGNREATTILRADEY